MVIVSRSRALRAVSDPGVRQRVRLFVLMGADFLAMILVVVYVGRSRCCFCS